jgi:hypothetical protein
MAGDSEEDEGSRGPMIRLGRPRGGLGGGGDGPLIPVMARLGPADLETVDALITAGRSPSLECVVKLRAPSGSG